MERVPMLISCKEDDEVRVGRVAVETFQHPDFAVKALPLGCELLDCKDIGLACGAEVEDMVVRMDLHLHDLTTTPWGANLLLLCEGKNHTVMEAVVIYHSDMAVIAANLDLSDAARSEEGRKYGPLASFELGKSTVPPSLEAPNHLVRICFVAAKSPPHRPQWTIDEVLLL